MVYEGPERRLGNVELVTKLGVLEERLDNFMVDTKDYRQELCDKMDSLSKDIREIRDYIYNLPCKQREGLYASFKNQLRILWGFVAGIVLLIIGEWLKKR